MPDVVIDPLCSLICPRCGGDHLERLRAHAQNLEDEHRIPFFCPLCDQDSILVLADQEHHRTAVVWDREP